MSMQVKFEDEEPGAETAAIDAAEQWLEVRLPPEYRAFLERRNGGRLETNEFPLAAPMETGSVMVLYGVGRDEFFDLVRHAVAYRYQVPAGLVAVGHSGGGDPIAVSTRDHDYGQVFYSDHEVGPERQGDPPGDESLYFAAADFDAFLEALRPPPPLEGEVGGSGWVSPKLQHLVQKKPPQ